MTIPERLSTWKEAGMISGTQYQTISAIARKDRFSVFFELNALLYLGVLSLIAGAGLVIQAYAASLGDAAVISSLTLILIASLYYCFTRGLPYSAGQVESPNFAFDYVLYLACLTFGLELGYLETRFHVMQNQWDYYLLASAVIFFGLAYRFDNRLVLSLALSTLAGWFGVRTSRLMFLFGASVRGPALIYGAVVMLVGTWFFWKNVKKHFTDTYFHVGVILLFMGFLTEVVGNESWADLGAVLLLGATAIFGGIKFGRFAFVVYGILFCYVAISSQLLRGFQMDSTLALTYFVVSGSLITVSVVLLARRFGREE
jgi:Predicted membrane protein (DUF2157)